MNQVPLTRTQESQIQQGALQQAMLKANEQHKVASNVQPINQKDASLVSIVPRLSVLGEPLVFLPASVNYEANTIDFWDGKKGSKVRTAPLEFYKISKPFDADRTEDSAKLGASFAKEFGHALIHSRQRLVKQSSLQRDAEGKASQVDIEDFKKRLIAAVTKAVNEM